MGKIYFKPFNIDWQHLGLIKQLIRRDIQLRYRGSLLGFFWPLFNPFLYLGIYLLIFSYFLPLRAGNVENGQGGEGFILSVFLGLIVFNLFSDCINRAPTLITSNPNYVKKVVFPLELLAFVPVGAAFYNLVIGFIAWSFMYLYFFGSLSWHVILGPIIAFPLILFILGLSWILSALGVYVRDINHLMAPVTQLLMFLSPIFYTLKEAPQWAKQLILLNPVSFIIEQERLLLINGSTLDILGFIIYISVGLMFFLIGIWFFNASRSSFSDVL